MARRRPVEPAGEANLVYGVHPVAELLERRSAEVERVYVARGRGGLGRLLRVARERGVPVSHLEREHLVRKLGRSATHQGVAAQVAAYAYRCPEEILAQAAKRAGALVVLVDRVADAGNLGAILRTSAAAGATGVVLSADATVGVTAHVAKAAAGALERIPVARSAKPSRWLEEVRSAGLRTIALDPRGARPWDRVDYRESALIVVGGEARGARPAVLRGCDISVAIPLAHTTESLNVAVSLGVVLYEAVRQRRAGT